MFTITDRCKKYLLFQMSYFTKFQVIQLYNLNGKLLITPKRQDKIHPHLIINGTQFEIVPALSFPKSLSKSLTF